MRLRSPAPSPRCRICWEASLAVSGAAGLDIFAGCARSERRASRRAPASMNQPCWGGPWSCAACSAASHPRAGTCLTSASFGVMWGLLGLYKAADGSTRWCTRSGKGPFALKLAAFLRVRDGAGHCCFIIQPVREEHQAPRAVAGALELIAYPRFRIRSPGDSGQSSPSKRKRKRHCGRQGRASYPNLRRLQIDFALPLIADHGIMKPKRNAPSLRSSPEGFHTTIDLNILQERRLARLLDYERATCTVDETHDLVYHCANFPIAPTTTCGRASTRNGALMQKSDDRAAPWSPSRRTDTPYFLMLKQEEEERSAASVAKRASWAPPRVAAAPQQ